MAGKGRKKRKVVMDPLVMIGDMMVLEQDVDTEVKIYGQVASPLPFDITVPWHTEPGTASVQDYVESSGSLLIKAGDLIGHFSLVILGDNEIEGYESFKIVFGDPTPESVRLQDDPCIRYVIIYDDDA